MASSGNFATWNPLANTQAGLSYSGSVYSNGNTRFRGNTGGTATTQLTHGLSSSKWYIEIYIDGSPAGGFPMIGIVASGVNSTTLQNTSNAAALAITSDLQTVNGTKRVFGSTSSTSYGSGFSDGDICQMAIDIDNGKIWWGKNNTWFASGDPAAGSNAGDTFTGGTEMMVFVGSYSGAAYSICNAGQDDTFAGNVTAAGNADGNGFGVFKYSPPTGFLALCSGNLPVSSDIDPAQTDDDYPAKNFNVVPYTGNQTDGRAVTGVGFAPDLVWIKQRVSFSNPNILTDTVRGATKRIESNVDIAEATDSDGVQSFTSDGFTLGTNDKYNWTSSHTYVAWCWKGGGAPTATNSAGAGATPTSGSVKIDGSNLGSALAGSIPATKLSANTKGGFSIITYTGTGSNATIAHGLSAKPDFILTKRLNSSQTWGVYHTSLGATKYLALNSTAAAGTDSSFWNDTEPTTSVISLGTEGRVNGNSQNYVAYAWHNVEGYSRFGSYEGNANADGTFVYTGFRPRFLFTKRTESTGGWRVRDTGRDTYNPSDTILWWDSNSLEYSNSAYSIDILSNGFKLRTSSNDFNASEEWVYGAWGDVPFKYNNTF